MEEQFYPDVCLFCGMMHGLSAEHPEICRRCLADLDVRTERIRRLPTLNVICGYWYEDPLRRALLALKFGRDTVQVRVLGDLLACAIRDSGQRFEGVLAVPLGAERRRQRGFDQAVLLAENVAHRLHLPDWSGALVRIRETKRQSELKRREQRIANVNDAFSVERYAPDLVLRKGEVLWQRGRRLLLIDDVMTTGATMEAAARPLRNLGHVVTGAVVASEGLPVVKRAISQMD